MVEKALLYHHVFRLQLFKQPKHGLNGLSANQRICVVDHVQGDF